MCPEWTVSGLWTPILEDSHESSNSIAWSLCCAPGNCTFKLAPSHLYILSPQELASTHYFRIGKMVNTRFYEVTFSPVAIFK